MGQDPGFDVEKLYNNIGVLGSKYTVQILDALEEPMSAEELSENQDIPKATVYRRIKDLKDIDYIEEKGARLDPENSKQQKRYRRTSKVSEDLSNAAVYFSEFESRDDFVNEFLDGSDGI